MSEPGGGLPSVGARCRRTAVRRSTVTAAFAAATAAVLVASGCTSGSADGRRSASSVPTVVTRSGTATGAASATPNPSRPNTTTAAPACPATPVPPDPHRPRVRLAFAVAADHRSVTGTEDVSFVPDLPITELVFRLTANTAPTVASGTSIMVTSARADDGTARAGHSAGPPRFSRDGAAASSQGGLLHIPFRRQIAAGTAVHATVHFTLRLGRGAFDRFGYLDGVSWFGSAQPLLAWQRGYGWHTEPMIQFTAESATSEAAFTDLTVTAPAGDVVVMSGRPTAGRPDGSTRRRWHATIAAARDVSVAAGPFTVRDVRIGPTAVRVAGLDAGELDAVIADERFALAGLTRYFGPFPFPTLSLALLPSRGGGIEYPSSIFLLGHERLVDVHETAHQWFYAMVGDSQAQHAWLDEAFASYAEQLLDNDAPPPSVLALPSPVDRPTAAYGHDDADYYRITYDKGAAALHRARAASGPAAFDAAIRCYVNTNAWRIAEPGDVARALSALPAAAAVLKQAGALP